MWRLRGRWIPFSTIPIRDLCSALLLLHSAPVSLWIASCFLLPYTQFLSVCVSSRFVLRHFFFFCLFALYQGAIKDPSFLGLSPKPRLPNLPALLLHHYPAFLGARERERAMKPRRACELCGGAAVVHCEPDSAYLCRACDAHVHGANFLVARHPRLLLCRECGVLDPDQRPVSGLGFLPHRFICRSCNDAYQGEGEGAGGDSDLESDSESASSSCCSSSLRSVTTSSCVSNAGSEAAARSGAAIVAVPAGGDGPIKAACSGSWGATELSDCANRRPGRRRAAAAARRELDARTEAVVLSWCRRIGLGDARAPGAASHALVLGAQRMTGAPFRVVAAAAVWFAARLCCAEAAAMGGRRGEGALLRRLEACSGVPAKLIVVAEARLARAMRRRHVADKEEGWAECS
ncbi:hypothetical protein Taro_023575 [Colocasia esculenta]|uniref:B box-type domain-containing protein n=1 Tax=Colocasia esculenta TaxID=4460 RepID=A0A843VB74_COLES|nr:hypothetical protein [Colocasia esculenta]